MSDEQHDISGTSIAPGDDTTPSASASSLAFVAGTDENEDDKNSIFPDTSPTLPGLAIDDRLFYGDELKELPDSLTEAVSKTKHVDGLTGTYRHIRFKNTLQINYELASDGSIEDDSIVVTVNSQKNGNTVTVIDTTEDSKSKFDADLNLFLPDNPEPPSYTILSSDWKQKTNPVITALFGGQKKRAEAYERHVKVQKGVFKNKDNTLIPGIRAATVWGTANPYTSEIVNDVGAGDNSIRNPIYGSLSDPIVPDNPIIYSWIELTLLSDGTTYVRIPDASIFPLHTGYLQGPSTNGASTKRAVNGLIPIFDKNEEVPEGTYGAAIREDTNHVWDEFKKEANQGRVVPYKSSNSVYLKNYKNGHYRHPVMAYGENKAGESIGQREVLNKLPDDPLFPMIKESIPFLPVI